MEKRIRTGLAIAAGALILSGLAYATAVVEQETSSGAAVWIKESNSYNGTEGDSLLIKDDKQNQGLAEHIYGELKAADAESENFPYGDIGAMRRDQDDKITMRDQYPVRCYKRIGGKGGVEYACVISKISKLWSHKSLKTASR